MRMYGIVVEGVYDESALKELIIKCLGEDIEVISRICGSKELTKFPAFLESFKYEKGGSNVDKAIVIRDAHGKNPEDLKKKMKDKISSRNYPFEVKFMVIVQELEAWLLADEEAISKVTQKPMARIKEDLESINDPKEKLKEILSQSKISYTPSVARNIAKESNLDKIQSRCSTFREFYKAVRDC